MLNVPIIPKVNKTEAAPAAMAAATNDPQSPPPAPVVDLRLVTLSKSIRSHQGEVRELRLRDITASDYIEIGKLPFSVRGGDEDRRIEVDFKVMAQWIARLTGYDELIIGQLTAKDWLAVTGRVNALIMQAGIDDVGKSDASLGT